VVQGKKRLGGEKEKDIWERQRCKQNKLADLVLVFKYSYASTQAGFNGVASRALNRTKEDK
jgi:hypothetical protein